MAIDVNATKLTDIIVPEVMADEIIAKVDRKIAVLPYAKLDNTLEGRAGASVTIPKYKYIGDAVDVEEGADIPVRKLAGQVKEYKIKKAGVGAELTDEAVLSGVGNPLGVANAQLAQSIVSKCDVDAMEELLDAPTSIEAKNIISYDTIVNAIDAFNEEENSEKIIFVHPKQVTQLRLDPLFFDKSTYGNEVMMNGEIGMIANARVVPSKKVKMVNEYYKANPSGALQIVSAGGNNSTTVDLEKVEITLPHAKVGEKVDKVAKAIYLNPIVKLNNDAESEEDTPALTFFLKRDVNIETERHSRRRTTEVTVDRMYTVALTNESKVLVAKVPQQAIAI